MTIMPMAQLTIPEPQYKICCLVAIIWDWAHVMSPTRA